VDDFGEIIHAGSSLRRVAKATCQTAEVSRLTNAAGGLRTADLQ